jgi:hypothetical protein
MRVGLVTYRGAPALTDDDRLVAAELERRGVRAEPVVWDDTAVAWSGFDRLVLRSCWDYHLRLAEFLVWVEAREAERTPLWNPPGVVRWNAHKSYLRQLEQAGVPVLPTAWLPGGTDVDLSRLLAERAWTDAVVKPAVSASAYGTWRTSASRAREDQGRLDELLGRGDALVQPFAPEVAEPGEWSLVFFAGGYSHAVLKTPAAGDFRVQSELGGRQQALEPAAALVSQARAVLDRVDGPWLYARVDGVARDGVLVLLELEMIEPHLFLAEHPLAPAGLAQAILAT